MGWAIFGALFKNMGMFKKLFLFVFVFITLISSVTYAIQEQDIIAGLGKMGEQLISPVEKAYDSAIKINEGNMLSILPLLGSLYSIFIWMWVLKWIVQNIVIMDDSRKTNSWIGAILLFFVLQIMILLIRGTDVNVLWKMWGEIFRAIKTTFTGSNLKDVFTINNTCTDGICTI